MDSVKEYDKERAQSLKPKNKKCCSLQVTGQYLINPSFTSANKAKHCLCGSEENKYLHIKNVHMLSADMSVMKANGWQYSDMRVKLLAEVFYESNEGAKFNPLQAINSQAHRNKSINQQHPFSKHKQKSVWLQ